jgi:hypothetical protein
MVDGASNGDEASTGDEPSTGAGQPTGSTPGPEGGSHDQDEDNGWT